MRIVLEIDGDAVDERARIFVDERRSGPCVVDPLLVTKSPHGVIESFKGQIENARGFRADRAGGALSGRSAAPATPRADPGKGFLRTK
jgi:hypothetical protein